MRFLFLSLMFIVTFSSCKEKVKNTDTSLINITPSATNNRSSKDLPEITFESYEFDFGDIVEGNKVEHTYYFENTGTSDLIVSSVKPSCGCTAVKSWSKEPYAPGEKGEITIVFDSNRRPGKINKSITVSCNTSPSSAKLFMNGMVIGPQ